MLNPLPHGSSKTHESPLVSRYVSTSSKTSSSPLVSLEDTVHAQQLLPDPSFMGRLSDGRWSSTSQAVSPPGRPNQNSQHLGRSLGKRQLPSLPVHSLYKCQVPISHPS